ncbi:hypothetical protein BD410DRAFT_810485, partial [Rickenella mellea]
MSESDASLGDDAYASDAAPNTPSESEDSGSAYEPPSDDDDFGRLEDLEHEDVPTTSDSGVDTIQERFQMPISWLRRAYERKEPNTILQDHMHRRQLFVDEELIEHGTDDNGNCDHSIRTECGKFFIDFTMFVSRFVGLGAVLPSSTSDHMWTLNINIKAQPHNMFSPKHGLLGFNPEGSMIYLGKCGIETVWIAMVSHTFDNPTSDEDLEESSASSWKNASCHVSDRQFRCFAVFLASCLASIGTRDIFCSGNMFFDVMNKELFNKTTNIL